MTSVPAELSEVLACPRCRGPLEPREEPEALDCRACGLRYRVDGGIPVMLVAEATPIPGAEPRL